MLDRPPRAVRRGDTFPGCTRENTYPMLDVALAALSVVGAGLMATGSIEITDEKTMMKRPPTDDERVIFGVSSGLEGVLFGFSALYGYDATERCRQITAAMNGGAP